MLVVIGGGPYGIATAAKAIEAGIETVVVGRPLGFWTDNMPGGMYLRSGPDWHLDASGVHTFEAFLEERGIAAADIDPVPIAVFLDYARWFQHRTHVTVTENMVTGLDGNGNGSFLVTLGGRQSAYEWAALAGDHGAERVDIVHRHDVPRFERVSWKFADPYLEQTLARPDWWRTLPAAEREAIARQFWEVGRLTLEWWLTPRLQGERFRRHPQASVVSVAADNEGPARARLSDGTELEVDRIVLATGYKADLGRVPYLAGVLDD